MSESYERRLEAVPGELLRLGEEVDGHTREGLSVAAEVIQMINRGESLSEAVGWARRRLRLEQDHDLASWRL
ncbi:hypothetical protein [Thiohalorhabdus sp.]|uniref:hypothetical protein n=1 Tax=Thiohalorhabdus sp. TaxID=3094134 RepID=UPI002FC32209